MLVYVEVSVDVSPARSRGKLPRNDSYTGDIRFQNLRDTFRFSNPGGFGKLFL
jgi:hypothetical protein